MFSHLRGPSLQGFLRCFRDAIRVPRIRENYHQIPRIRESRVPTRPYRVPDIFLKKKPDFLLPLSGIMYFTWCSFGRQHLEPDKQHNRYTVISFPFSEWFIDGQARDAATCVRIKFCFLNRQIRTCSVATLAASKQRISLHQTTLRFARMSEHACHVTVPSMAALLEDTGGYLQGSQWKIWGAQELWKHYLLISGSQLSQGYGTQVNIFRNRNKPGWNSWKLLSHGLITNLLYSRREASTQIYSVYPEPTDIYHFATTKLQQRNRYKILVCYVSTRVDSKTRHSCKTGNPENPPDICGSKSPLQKIRPRTTERYVMLRKTKELRHNKVETTSSKTGTGRPHGTSRSWWVGGLKTPGFDEAWPGRMRNFAKQITAKYRTFEHAVEPAYSVPALHISA